MRPDVVWFGETPYELDRIATLLEECDLFISIGTSGHVYPAAGFVAEAARNGAHTIELNLETVRGPLPVPRGPLRQSDGDRAALRRRAPV